MISDAFDGRILNEKTKPVGLPNLGTSDEKIWKIILELESDLSFTVCSVLYTVNDKSDN